MSSDPSAHAWRLVRHLHVVKPDGAGPFPVMVQLHGCGGVQPFQFAYAERAKALGVAAIVLDSLAPRGITRRAAHATVCTGLRLRGRERAADLAAALLWLSGQPWADLKRLGAAGWSHGGWTLMEALTAPEDCGLNLPLKVAVLFYPYAGVLSRSHRLGWPAIKPKVFACLAEKDAVVGTRLALRAFERLRRDGLEIDVLTLKGATHAFDDDAASDPRTRFSLEHQGDAHAFYDEALGALAR